jgi:hypothetical protein
MDIKNVQFEQADLCKLAYADEWWWPAISRIEKRIS